MTDLSEVFYVCLITTISAVVLKLASMAYKSKCRECSVWCIKVIRDVNLEEQEMEFKIKHNVKDNEEEKV